MALSGEQHAEWRRLVELEEAGREEESARWRRIAEAARSPGFVGDLRRAALSAGRSLNEIAGDAELDPLQFFEWMGGAATLQVDEIERLVDSLGLRLVAESQA